MDIPKDHSNFPLNELKVSFTVSSRVGVDREGKPFLLLLTSLNNGSGLLQDVTYVIEDDKIKSFKLHRP